MKKYLLFASIPVFMFVAFSCSKTANSDVSSSSTVLESAITAAVSSVVATSANQTSTEDIQSVTVTALDTITKGSHGKGHIGHGSNIFDIPYISSCATVTISGTTYPQTITIDYGTGCTNSRGQFKKGKITIVVSDTISNTGATKTITYTDFYVDSTRIDLNATLKNLGKNASDHWVISANYDQTTTKIDGDVIQETKSDTTEWIGGFETAVNTDDIYYKSGSGSISVNDTISYSKKITKPLFFDYSCKYILSGTEVLYKNSSTVTIDYGDGTCDDIATVTTNGITETVSLNTLQFKADGVFNKYCHHGKKH